MYIFVSLSSLFDVKRPKGVQIQLNDQPLHNVVRTNGKL